MLRIKRLYRHYKFANLFLCNSPLSNTNERGSLVDCGPDKRSQTDPDKISRLITIRWIEAEDWLR